MTVSAVHHQRIKKLQKAIRDEPNVDGWLFYDFRHSDPLAYRLLLLDDTTHVTRRWYYWVPTSGTPVKLLHAIEPHILDALPGECRTYVSWQERESALQSILADAKRVAMQYSPLNAIPYVARVDAGTIELVKSFGMDVVTAADLVQRCEAVWDAAQVESHRVAAEGLRRIVDEAFSQVGREVDSSRGSFGEFELQQFIISRFSHYGLVTGSPPIAAVNEHSADPHYSPSPRTSAPLRRGDLVLIDLWAKQPHAGAVYADITWTGYVGPSVPDRYMEIFQIVREARDTALEYVRQKTRAGSLPCGWEVDDACRRVIQQAGYGDRFIHRTGHSIGVEVHGNGANIDNLETQDSRRLLPHTCFSIEPGIYLPGEFGIRSELDVYIADGDVSVYGQPLQTEIMTIRA